MYYIVKRYFDLLNSLFGPIQSMVDIKKNEMYDHLDGRSAAANYYFSSASRIAGFLLIYQFLLEGSNEVAYESR